jgi:hypothetical protein
MGDGRLGDLSMIRRPQSSVNHQSRISNRQRIDNQTIQDQQWPLIAIMTRLIIVLVLSLAAGLHAQNAPDPSGHWEGTIQTPEMAIAIEVDLANNSSGLAGTISVPPQNLKGLPLVIETAEGRSLTFRFNGAPGSRLFRGTLSEDGQSITGQFVQSGFTMPFGLTRRGEARIEAPIRSAPIGKELEGPWSATLEGTSRKGCPARSS